MLGDTMVNKCLKYIFKQNIYDFEIENILKQFTFGRGGGFQKVNHRLTLLYLFLKSSLSLVLKKFVQQLNKYESLHPPG